MSDRISITYCLTLSEFMRACESHWRAVKQGTASTLGFGGLALLAGIALWNYLGWPAIFLSVAASVILALMGIRQLLWRKAFKDAKKFHGPITATFAAEGLHVETIEGNSDLNWSFFDAYLETP